MQFNSSALACAKIEELRPTGSRTLPDRFNSDQEYMNIPIIIQNRDAHFAMFIGCTHSCNAHFMQVKHNYALIMFSIEALIFH